MDYEKEYKRIKQEQEWAERDERKRREDEEDRRERERRARREEAQLSQYYADDWDEAFRKGIPRYQAEASEELKFQAQYPDEQVWFPSQVNQIVFARDAYYEEHTTIQGEVERIRKEADERITALEQQARDKAAARTDERFGETCLVSEFLRTNNYMGLVNW